MSWSWQARRSYLDSIFGNIHQEIEDLQYRNWEQCLIQPITPHSSTGWASVDTEISQLRERFATAQSDQDHNAVGNSCVRVLELLGDVVFDPQKYLKPGEETPPRGNTKDHFEKVICSELEGSDQRTTRAYARHLVELAQMVKHRKTPSRRDAGIACDGVIALVYLMRRITL